MIAKGFLGANILRTVWLVGYPIAYVINTQLQLLRLIACANCGTVCKSELCCN